MGVGVAVGSGVGVSVGVGVGVAVGWGVAVGVGVGVGVGEGAAVAVAVGRDVGVGLGVAVGWGVAVGSGVGSETGVDCNSGWSWAVTVAGMAGVGVGCGAVQAARLTNTKQRQKGTIERIGEPPRKKGFGYLPQPPAPMRKPRKGARGQSLRSGLRNSEKISCYAGAVARSIYYLAKRIGKLCRGIGGLPKRCRKHPRAISGGLEVRGPSVWGYSSRGAAPARRAGGGALMTGSGARLWVKPRARDPAVAGRGRINARQQAAFRMRWASIASGAVMGFFSVRRISCRLTP